MAKMSYKAKASLPKSDFALKGTGKYGGKGSYPIPNASHARDALSRVAANGTPTQKAEVRAKVHAKFPSIGNNPQHAHHASMKQAWK